MKHGSPDNSHRNRNAGQISRNDASGEDDDKTIRDLKELEKYMKEVNSEWDREEQDRQRKDE